MEGQPGGVAARTLPLNRGKWTSRLVEDGSLRSTRARQTPRSRGRSDGRAPTPCKSLHVQMTVPSSQTTPRHRATCDLRRLRLKGSIERIDGTNTYRVTYTACASPPFSPSSLLASLSLRCPISPHPHDRAHRSRVHSRSPGVPTSASSTSYPHNSPRRAMSKKLASTLRKWGIKSG